MGNMGIPWLESALQEIGWEAVYVSRQLRPRAGLSVMWLPWDEWAKTAPRSHGSVYAGVGACRDSYGDTSSGVGLVTKMGNRWWGVAVPLEPWVGNTTRELQGITLGRHMVAHLGEMGAAKVE